MKEKTSKVIFISWIASILWLLSKRIRPNRVIIANDCGLCQLWNANIATTDLNWQLSTDTDRNRNATTIIVTQRSTCWGCYPSSAFIDCFQFSSSGRQCSTARRTDLWERERKRENDDFWGVNVTDSDAFNRVISHR